MSLERVGLAEVEDISPTLVPITSRISNADAEVLLTKRIAMIVHVTTADVIDLVTAAMIGTVMILTAAIVTSTSETVTDTRP